MGGIVDAKARSNPPLKATERKAYIIVTPSGWVVQGVCREVVPLQGLPVRPGLRGDAITLITPRSCVTPGLSACVGGRPHL